VNKNERIEELGSRYVLGTLSAAELAEFEEALRESEEARRIFAGLCSDEMLLWQHHNPEHARSAPFTLPSRAPERSPWRLALRAAALLIAFVGGWLLSARRPGAEEHSPPAVVDNARTPSVLPILYPPTQQVIFPLGFDEHGRPAMQVIRKTQPLEILNL
jgi:hypothetical protein